MVNVATKIDLHMYVNIFAKMYKKMYKNSLYICSFEGNSDIEPYTQFLQHAFFFLQLIRYLLINDNIMHDLQQSICPVRKMQTYQTGFLTTYLIISLVVQVKKKLFQILTE